MPYTVVFDPSSVGKQAAIIPNATCFNDGVMSKELACQGLALDNVAIYVATTGNDNNRGTLASPILTIHEAVNRIPMAWKKRCDIFLGAGVFPAENLRAQIGSRLGATNGDLGGTLHFIGEVTDLLGTLVATYASVTQIGDETLTMVPNEYRGKHLEILTGANAGEKRLIIGNDEVLFSFNSTFDNSLEVGDQFRIIEPASEIAFSGFCGFGAKGDIIDFTNIKMTATYFSFILFIGVWLKTETCEFNLDGGSYFQMTSGSFLTDGPSLDSVYIHDGTLIMDAHSELQANIVSDNTRILAQSGSNLQFTGLNATDLTVEVDGCSTLQHTADEDIPGMVVGSNSSDADMGIFTLTNRSTTGADFSDIIISDGDGHGVLVDSGSFAALGNGVAGTGNVGVGCKVSGMSQATFIPPGEENVGVTITGNVNDAQVGSAAAQTWASLDPAGATQGLNRIEPVVA